MFLIKRPLLIASAAVALASCISIDTHERRLAELRALRTQNEQMQAELATLKDQTVRTIEEKAALQQELGDVRGYYDELVNELKGEIAQGDVKVSERDGLLAIAVEEKILFRSGQSDLNPKGKEVLTKVAGVLKNVTGHVIRVDGHSDNVPIAGSLKNKYPSNWELSAARAAVV